MRSKAVRAILFQKNAAMVNKNAGNGTAGSTKFNGFLYIF